MTASQIEFPLSVAVCAWCKPLERGVGLGALSHGICLRHYKKLSLQLQGKLHKRARRQATNTEEPQTQFELLIPPLAISV